jgi:hypothetical protein
MDLTVEACLQAARDALLHLFLVVLLVIALTQFGRFVLSQKIQVAE